MIHLIQHKNKKYEVVTVQNGKLIVGSNPQQYSRKSGCYGNIKSQMKNFHGCTLARFQDDTVTPSTVYNLTSDGSIFTAHVAPKKKYVMAIKKK